jgi:hypothetical protein
MLGWFNDCQYLGLPLEAGHALGVTGEGVRQDLDGHIAVEPGVARAVDLAHATGAEGGEDLIGSEAGASGEWHAGALL